MSRVPSALERFCADYAVVVCCGTGGVGKTTVAAALGVGAAELGLRCCVVTIDPARRLADALGVEAVTNRPHLIAGDWPGELSAVMLDARATFDELVGRYAADETQRERILANRIYRNLVGGLSGTQEYMATEKLYELHSSGNFDLVIVDTPPARQALDFLEAPGRLSGFLENRVFRLLLAPGRAGLRAAGLATQLLLRTIGRVAGSEVVEDTVTFFQAFEGMEQGFHDRARHVEALLANATTGFVLVVQARDEELDESRYFAARLNELGHELGVLVANRLIEPFAAAAVPHGPPGGALDELVANLEELALVATAEANTLGTLVDELHPPAVVRLPLLSEDVHDLEGLRRLARHLLES